MPEGQREWKTSDAHVAWERVAAGEEIEAVACDLGVSRRALQEFMCRRGRSYLSAKKERTRRKYLKAAALVVDGADVETVAREHGLAAHKLRDELKELGFDLMSRWRRRCCSSEVDRRVYLKVLAGVPQTDIAKEMNVTPAMVNKRVQRYRRRMKGHGRTE
jgi:transposase-like protein